ncbi:hypothetical protein AVEN_254577-1, partial [Araneus ventricosus]
MTRTTPELAPSFSNFRTTPAGGCLSLTYDLTDSTGPIHDTSSVESGYEPGTLLSRSRHLSTLERLGL